MQSKFHFFHLPPYEQDHKLIMFVANPRSHSTLPVRIWSARNDATVVMNEIGVYAYNLLMKNQQKPELTENLFKGGLETFDEVSKTILEQLATQDVFIKDTRFAAKHYLTDNFDPLYSKNTYIFFMLRDIADCMVSNYKILQMGIDDNLKDAWSYKDMVDLHDGLKAANTNVFIIDSMELVENPEVTVADICSKVDVPFIPESLNWNPINITDKLSPFCGFVPQWQDKIVASSGVDTQLTTHALRDEDGNPTFAEISDEHRQSYLDFYHEQLPYFQQMRENLLNQKDFTFTFSS